MGAAAYRAGVELYNEYDGLTHDYTPRNRGAVASAAYRAGENLHDGNAAHDFTQKQGIAHTEIMLPENAPQTFLDRQTLWNAVEMAEKRNDARTAREVEIALPNELTLRENIELVREYVADNFISKGMIADVAIHSGHRNQHQNDAHDVEAQHDKIIAPNNPHAHILLTTRPVDKEGFAKKKNREWESPRNVYQWREQWARAQNREFERRGLEVKVTHESHATRGLDREPTIHLGPTDAALEKQGIRTIRGDKNRDVRARNRAKDERDRQYRRELESRERSPNHSIGANNSREQMLQWLDELEQKRRQNPQRDRDDDQDRDRER